jgi:predicted ATPase
VIRTPDQRLRVFVSSTLQEMAPERAAVKEAITRLRLVPVMFELGARPHPPADLYQAYLEQSHVFIGLYWERYGWVAPDMEISGLEHEWVLAGDHPKLVYIKDSDHRDERLTRLLDRIRDDGSTSYRSFSTPEELRDLVETDLAVMLSEVFELSITRTEPEPERSKDPALPQAPSPIIGRDVELATLDELVCDSDARLVTITGSGGSGKTRLAIEVARRCHERHGQRVVWVDLTGLRDADLVLPTIASSLGIKDAGGRSLVDAIATVLRGEQVLLVIDNFEHVIRGASDLADVLAATEGVRMLVTSRQALRLRWEQEFPLLPLAVPDPDEHATVDAVAASPAVDLLVERVRRVRPRFHLDESNVAIIAELARRLDGLPLALELAAARMRVQQPADLLARLEHRLDSLAGSSPDLPERHRTMRSTIAWSHDHLEPDERAVFRRLGVFAGGTGIEAAEHVCSGDDVEPDGVLDIIESLVDRSLVVSSLDADGATSDRVRFTVLETIREYAVEQLVETGEAEATWDRHLDFHVRLAEQAWEGFWTSEMPDWLCVLDDEHDNLRTAMDHAAGAGDAHLGCHLAAAMWPYWDVGGQYREGERRLRELLALVEEPCAARGRALSALGWMIALQGDFESAQALMENGLVLVRQYGTEVQVGWTVAELGNIAFSRGQAQRTEELFSEALDIAARNDQIFLRGFGHFGLAYAHFLQGDLAAMRHELQLSLDLTRLMLQPWGIAWAQFSVGIVSVMEGDTRTAVGPITESLELRWSIRDARGLGESIELLANLASLHGELEWSALLHGAAELQREATGLAILPFLQPLHDESVERLRAAVAPDELDRVWQLGRSMPLEKLVAEALGRTAERGPLPT